MTSPRDEILARIRSVDRGQIVAHARAYRREQTMSEAERARLFCDRVGDYHADVRRVGEGRLGAAIEGALKARAARRIAIPPALPRAWRPSGAELVEDDELATDLDALDGVVTGCTVAIAETGTIVLAAGASEGRRALTLVPDLHVCLVRADQIVQRLSHAIDLLDPLVKRERRPLTFISGPSATSDIELSRVEGVHGPRQLVVFVVDAHADALSST